LGLAWRKLGEPRLALTAFDDALALDPGLRGALMARGRTLREIDQPQLALEDFAAAKALAPSLTDAYLPRASLLTELRELPLALAEYDAALAVAPKSERLHITMLKNSCQAVSAADTVKGVALATKACELTEWKDADMLDALASADAQAGLFD